jgi:hypothetical protein
VERAVGVIGVAEVVEGGTKIAFVSGPLVGMEAKVVKVNKSRRQVEIAIGDGDVLFRNVWCSIDYIESNIDFDVLHRDTQQDKA